MNVKKCRNCKSKKLSNLFSLGNLSFTGKFPNKITSNIKKTKLSLKICKKCSLVQLSESHNLKYLYGPDYGYRTGINKTMTNHMRDVQKLLVKKSKLSTGDHVLDIASNDATLLNMYNNNIIKFGIDPLVKKYNKYYKKINFKVSNFFSYNQIEKKKIKNKFKIITALSVFYDSQDPNKFLNDVYKILDDDGIFMLEHQDLLSIIKFKMFDTICHEHLLYYSSKIIIEMASKNNLRVFDLKKNNINGGSVQYLICKKNSKYKTNKNSIKKILKEEYNYKLESKKTYTKFYSEINKIKIINKNLLNNLVKSKKTIHGYGASTKGNVLLQYFGIGRNYMKFISDRNPKKNNHYTPGTKVKIISESRSRKLKPDYYFVLPWHFKDEILKREKKIRTTGCKFIFPLPKLKIY